MKHGVSVFAHFLVILAIHQGISSPPQVREASTADGHEPAAPSGREPKREPGE